MYLGSLIGTARQIAKRTSPASRVAVNWWRLRQGDPDARAYFGREGLVDIGNLILPGLGDAGQTLIQNVLRDFDVFRGHLDGSIIEGEVVAPWERFAATLPTRDWGLTIILGDRGEGKTQLAFKLAQMWCEQHDYRLEICNVWPDDVPMPLRRHAVEIDAERIIARMKLVAAYLNNRSAHDDLIDDGLVLERTGDRVTERQITKLQHRVIVWDEVGTSLSTLAESGQQQTRTSIGSLAYQIRHLKSHVIVIGQYMRQFPPSVMAGAIQMYKRPAPDTDMLDEFGGRVGFARRRWEEVEQAFTQIRRSPWARGALRDLRSWTYVIDNDPDGSGYVGILPFVPVGVTLDEDD